jgi:hypothetical protein
MLCILKMNGTEITGWVIGVNLSDAIQRAENGGALDLADALRTFTMPRGGKHPLLDGKYLVLGQ